MKAVSLSDENLRKKKDVKSGGDVCELCGEELEVDGESGECRCPACDNPEQ